MTPCCVAVAEVGCSSGAASALRRELSSADMEIVGGDNEQRIGRQMSNRWISVALSYVQNVQNASTRGTHVTEKTKNSFFTAVTLIM